MYELKFDEIRYVGYDDVFDYLYHEYFKCDWCFDELETVVWFCKNQKQEDYNKREYKIGIRLEELLNDEKSYSLRERLNMINNEMKRRWNNEYEID